MYIVSNCETESIEAGNIVKLNFLSQAIKRINKSMSIEEASNEIFDFIQSVTSYHMAVIYIIDYETNELVVLAARGTNVDKVKKRVRFKIGEGVVGWVAKEKKAIVLKDATIESKFKVRQHYDVDPHIRSYLAVPLIVAGNVSGILSISHSKPNIYGIKDVQLISIIASQVAALIEINKLLIRTQKFSDNILECINSGIMAVNDKTEVILFNKEAENVTGYIFEEVVGKTLDSLPFKIGCEDSYLLKTLFGDKTYTEVETYIANKSGMKVPVNISTSLIEDENEKKVGAVEIFRDMTKIKLLQEQIMMSDRLAAVGKCITGIVHEIRNPLLPIRTAASILLKRQNLSEDDLKLIDIIYNEAERLNKSMTNITSLVKPIKENSADSSSLMTAVNEIYDLVKYKCQEKDIFVKLPEGPDMDVNLSLNNLKQIFLNLFLNSIDAIGKRGKICIEICKKDNSNVTIIFSDDGCGISSKDINRLFEPFYTTKGTGIGLGLSLVFNIIHNVGGQIRVKSDKGEGAYFEITLPIS